MNQNTTEIPDVLKWYNGRNPRFVDLVSDYAGREVFLIEGDSMLRDCFADDLIDFDSKFATLCSSQYATPD